MEEKSNENAISLSKLNDRLAELDRIQPRSAKWIEIFKGVFAGNIFDWGALAVAQLLENNESFGLNDALKKIQPRPWLIDGFDAWMKRMEVCLFSSLFDERFGKTDWIYFYRDRHTIVLSYLLIIVALILY